MTVERRLLGLWYGPAWRTVALWPLEALYRLIVGLRRRAYRSGLLAREDAGAPVVVVGNLSVGGTGKTPIASWLASALRARGLVTAVVLRGYGGRHAGTPLRVTPDTDPAIAGDEAVLHAQRGAELVFVGRDRVQAARGSGCRRCAVRRQRRRPAAPASCEAVRDCRGRRGAGPRQRASCCQRDRCASRAAASHRWTQSSSRIEAIGVRPQQSASGRARSACV